MSLKEKISQDVIDALKKGDKFKVEVVRFVLSKIKQIEIDERRTLSDEEIINLLSTNIKQRNESISQFKKGGREDLVKKELDELALVQSYLPPALSDEELTALINDAIKESQAVGIKDLGKVMKIIVPKTKGRADSGKISEIIKQRLIG